MPQPQQPAASPIPRWLAILLAAAVTISAAVFIFLAFGRQGAGRQIESLFIAPFGGRRQVDILVLGEDAAGEVRRSDTIIIAHVDLEQRRLGIISVPRDFRVDIPGHGTQKINAAFSLGGVELTRATLERALGLSLPYQVVITVSALRELVDAMGGVVVDVDKRMYYRDRSQGLFINLRPGRQRLNGRQAEGYVRYRHDALGDLKRIERQQAFLKAVMTQALQKDKVLRLPAMLQAFLRLVHTNLTLRDMQALKELAQQAGSQGLVARTLPGTPVTIAGVSYLEPDWPACREQVREVWYGSKALVAVFNGTTEPGLAARISERLHEEGYRIETVGNAPEAASRTQIIAYRQTESAYQIRRLLGCGEVVESPDSTQAGADITVVLGTDVLAPPPATTSAEPSPGEARPEQFGGGVN